jgi:hypothetical protein
VLRDAQPLDGLEAAAADGAGHAAEGGLSTLTERAFAASEVDELHLVSHD